MEPSTTGLDYPPTARRTPRPPAPELALAAEAAAQGWTPAELCLALLTACPATASTAEVEAVVAAVAREPAPGP